MTNHKLEKQKIDRAVREFNLKWIQDVDMGPHMTYFLLECAKHNSLALSNDPMFNVSEEMFITAINYASKVGENEALDCFYSFVYNRNAVKNEALFNATKRGHRNCLEFLINWKETNIPYKELLEIAAENGYEHIIEYLSLKTDIDLYFLYFKAIKSGHLNVVSWFKEDRGVEWDYKELCKVAREYNRDEIDDYLSCH